MADADPKQVGFYFGLEMGRSGRQPLPPNPYPLRSEDRRQWANGYIAGHRLGSTQREEAEKIAKSFLMTTRADAVAFAKGRILHSTDWQDVQNDMANNERILAFLTEAGGDDMGAISVAQSVIREAEKELGSRLPANYSS